MNKAVQWLKSRSILGCLQDGAIVLMLAAFFFLYGQPCRCIPVQFLTMVFVFGGILPLALLVAWLRTSSNSTSYKLISRVLTIICCGFCTYLFVRDHLWAQQYRDRGLNICYSDSNLYELIMPTSWNGERLVIDETTATIKFRDHVLDNYQTLHIFKPEVSVAEIRRITGLDYDEDEWPFGKMLIVKANGSD